MTLVDGLITGLQVAAQPINLLFCFAGVFLGTLIGVLPGIGPATAMALLVPITVGASPASGVILLAGSVRDQALRERAQRLVSGFEGTRRVVNELAIGEPQGFWSRRRDNTITAHAKTALLDLTSLPGFDPMRVNVTTVNRVVYLMGRVTAEEDEAVTTIVRDVNGVDKVVKLFEPVQ